MVQMRVLVTVTSMLVSISALYAEEEVDGDINELMVYLHEMGARLNCHFTIEDRPRPDGAFPWMFHLKNVLVPDLDIATIDALVTKLNRELKGIKVRRSTKYPSVVHLIAEELLQQDYVMDDTVTLEYSGLLGLLPEHIGMLLNDRIRTQPWRELPIRVPGDLVTEVEISVENGTVRDVLTGAVPLDGYERFLWESQRTVVDGNIRVYVSYFGPWMEDEDP